MGYGRKLLAKAENGQKGMMLLVDVDNEPAIRLYQRAGFVKKTIRQQPDGPLEGAGIEKACK